MRRSLSETTPAPDVVAPPVNQPARLNLLLVVLGVAALLTLGRMWTPRPPASASVAARPEAPRVAPAPGRTEAKPAAPAAESVAALRPEALALLAELERWLARDDVRKNEAVFTFKNDAALQRFLARAGQAGLDVLGTIEALRTVRVGYRDPGALRRELSQNAADYEAAAGNGLVTIPRPPGRQERDAVEPVPFGNRTLDFLGAAALDRSQWGRGTLVAVLDTGVAPDATFGLGRLRSLDIGLGAAPGAGVDDGHGTAVAALVGGSARDAGGVAPAANLLSIRVTDASGTSDIFTLAHAIVAAVDAGARVVNISLGGYSTSAALDGAIGYATQRGALIVAAAGNDQAAQLAWPAADARVLSVGAIDAAEQQVRFSNSGAQLQLTAPGYGVQTAWLDGQRASVNGTSVSAPLVTGAVAAMMSQNPSLTPQQAAQLLLLSANDGGAPGADPVYGHGMLNLGWAMNRANPAYVDTAVSSHSYDAARNQMQFVVQNRSGRIVSGLALDLTVAGGATTQAVPSLAPGESYIARLPVDQTALRTTGALTFTSQLNNPAGVTDAVPANNRRASVLSPPRP